MEETDLQRQAREALERHRAANTTAAKQAAFRAQQEASAKQSARRGWAGDAASFEVAWPEIWRKLQIDTAVEAGRSRQAGDLVKF